MSGQQVKKSTLRSQGSKIIKRHIPSHKSKRLTSRLSSINLTRASVFLGPRWNSCCRKDKIGLNNKETISSTEDMLVNFTKHNFFFKNNENCMDSL